MPKKGKDELIDLEELILEQSLEEKAQKKKAKKVKKARANMEFLIVTIVFCGLFFSMIGYFIKFIADEKTEVLADSSFNARMQALELDMIRGPIVSNDGTILAGTNVDSEGNETRVYPYSNAFSHIVGYVGAGKSGLEDLYNTKLLTSHVNIIEREQNEIKGIKNKGDTLKTTLDVDLQMAAYRGLSVCNGAVVCIEPSTGAILAMASNPDFDPNTISEMYAYYSAADSTDTNLFNRAMLGLYPAGSTFKIFTTTAFLRSGMDFENYSYSCDGSFSSQGHVMNCINHKAHGYLDLKKSFGVSCNCSFSNIGVNVGAKEFAKTLDSLLFGEDLPSEFDTKKSSYYLGDGVDTEEIMQTSIGQGMTLVSPYHMALIASAICNDGMLMNPYVVSGIESKNGDIVSTTKPSTYKRLFSVEESQHLDEYMRYVCTDGTAKVLKDADNYSAYGKTGSADYLSTQNDCHSWFVGYARGDDGRELAVAVICEGMGDASVRTIPLTKTLFDTYFED